MKTIQFTETEIEALKVACAAGANWPGCESLKTIDLTNVADTDGFFQKDKQRDLLTNAVDAQLSSLIGGGQWGHWSFDGLRSAAFKLHAADIKADVADRIRGHQHPPTGRLLKQWVLTPAELDVVWEKGLNGLGLFA